jgi:aromatic-L-amino-acid decarboxylase
LAKWLENEIVKSSEFELVVPRSMNLVCFHFNPQKPYSIKELNNINEELLHNLNATGLIYLTHTKINEIFTLRMSVGQTNIKQSHIEKSWELIRKKAMEE